MAVNIYVHLRSHCSPLSLRQFCQFLLLFFIVGCVLAFVNVCVGVVWVFYGIVVWLLLSNIPGSVLDPT